MHPVGLGMYSHVKKSFHSTSCSLVKIYVGPTIQYLFSAVAKIQRNCFLYNFISLSHRCGGISAHFSLQCSLSFVGIRLCTALNITPACFCQADVWPFHYRFSGKFEMIVLLNDPDSVNL